MVVVTLLAAVALAATPACSRPVHVNLSVQGAAGSRIGVITVRNTGARCTLRGRPTVRVKARRQAKVQTSARPGVPRTVVLPYGHAAVAEFRWSNWCGGRVTSLAIGIPGGTIVQIPFREAPPCLGPGPSHIEIGAFTAP